MFSVLLFVFIILVADFFLVQRHQIEGFDRITIIHQLHLPTELLTESHLQELFHDGTERARRLSAQRVSVARVGAPKLEHATTKR